MSEDGNNIDLRPLEPHESILDLPEIINQVLVCEQDGEVLGYIFSTVYGWTNSWEVETEDSTPLTWAHWQTCGAAKDRLLDSLYEEGVYQANHILDDCPPELNYTYLLASYMNVVLRQSGKSYLEKGRIPDIFDQVEWRALKVAEKQAHSWGIENDLKYEPEPVEQSS